ncbi:MAG: family 20 glycosylhydrolase [Bacteroidales bacterium]
MKTTQIKTLVWMLFLSILLPLSCKKPIPKNLSQESIIPLPANIKLPENVIPEPANISKDEQVYSGFELLKDCKVLFDGNQNELERIATPFFNQIRKTTKFPIPFENLNANKLEGNIYIGISPTVKEEEGYNLEIKNDRIILLAKNPSGIFYGMQTLMQLLPDEIESQSAIIQDPIIVACGIIDDYPRYAYRGAMLDVSRHFLPSEDVKTYIDQIAKYKINYLHLHLSDDQGWRIEIKSWPKLTEIGGSTEVGGGKGGYFTQEQYKDIVNYAKDHFITIVPEIDMPGHTNAALASYAELNCDNKATKLYTGIDVGFSSLCVKKDITYKFIDDVIRELSEITPGPYIHIGGDESHSTPHDDYITFIDKIAPIVKKYNKKMIGWEEVATANIDQNTICQYWKSDSIANIASKKNAQIIYSNAKHCYLDMKYDTKTPLGLHWAGYIDVKTSYDWDPNTISPEIPEQSIAGIEAPIWTETIKNLKDLDFLAFPRIISIAEIGWTPKEKRNWEGYKKRLGDQYNRLKARNINFYKSEEIPWKIQDNKINK